MISTRYVLDTAAVRGPDDATLVRIPHLVTHRGPLRHAVGMAVALLREERALRRAARHVPMPMSWDWAAPRLIPLLSRPAFDPPGSGLVRVTTELGFAVEFGVDLGIAITEVDESVAQRWECSPDQLWSTALQNLKDRSERLPVSTAMSGALSGRRIRIVRGRPLWASSLVLVPDQLMRLFGDHDQLIAAAGRATLISLPFDTPTEVAASLVIDFEMAEPWPLFFAPFALEDRALRWMDQAADEDW